MTDDDARDDDDDDDDDDANDANDARVDESDESDESDEREVVGTRGGEEDEDDARGDGGDDDDDAGRGGDDGIARGARDVERTVVRGAQVGSIHDGGDERGGEGGWDARGDANRVGGVETTTRGR